MLVRSTLIFYILSHWASRIFVISVMRNECVFLKNISWRALLFYFSFFLSDNNWTILIVLWIFYYRHACSSPLDFIIFKFKLITNFWKIIIIRLISLTTHYRFIVAKSSDKRSISICITALIRPKIVRLCLILVLIFILTWNRVIHLCSFRLICRVYHEKNIDRSHSN